MKIADWLGVAGDEKAASILALAPPGISTVVEIGAGTGAVLAALDRAGFADSYWACEPQSNLFESIANYRVARLQGCENCTFDRAFGTRTFDLAILSHVAEHLLSPADLVGQALRRACYVIVEVPLDDNFAGRARARIRGAFGQPRLQNQAGHVQFFSERSAQDLIRFAGGEVLAARSYFPRESLARNEAPFKRLTSQLGKCDMLARAYCAHYAMLAQRRNVERWQHHYYPPE